VISFDRWHLGYLGCYGNDWIETPHLDRLASRAVVFDQHYSENIDPAAANHAWWTGRRQFPLSPAQQRSTPAWCDQLHQHGIKTHLIVESDGRDTREIAPPFESILVARGNDGFEVPEQETPFAQTVQAAIRWMKSGDRPSGPVLLWIKSRGIPSPWTPPRAFADLYLEEFGLAGERHETDDEDDDAHSTPETTPAANASADDDEPERKSGVDESLDWRYAAALYAAYVTLVDRWVGKLLQAIDESAEWHGALLIVTAASGQPLGEHGQLSDDRPSLRAESIHTPLWIRLPDSDQGGTRRQGLVQTLDIGPTLLDWHGLPASTATSPDTAAAAGVSLLPLIRNDQTAVRDSVLIGSGRKEWGLRTADFLYVEAGDDNDQPEPAALFEKPHDRWDQFNVATQFRDVVDALHETLQAIRQ
jgi:arylsulfatase A-like enzyme